MTNIPGPITVNWAFIVAVHSGGGVSLIDHEFVADVKSSRIAALDDINAAAVVVARQNGFEWYRPNNDVFDVAFMVYQTTDGLIAPSPDIFENLVPLYSPTSAHVFGAFGVLQNQITAHRVASLAIPVAADAALSFLKAEVQALDPEAHKKSTGGLIVA